MPKPARIDPLLILQMMTSNRETQWVRVWDPLVRSFHWSLVLSFFVAWLSANSWENLHIWAGFAAGGLILMRVVWGFVGTKGSPKRMEFWYRRSPQRLVPVLDSGKVREARVVALNNPPPLVPGMVTVRLNSVRELCELLIIPSKEVLASE